MRIVKRGNPAVQVRMEYDKVKVGDKTYVFDLMEGRVVEESESSNTFKGSQSSVKFGSNIAIDCEEEPRNEDAKETSEKQEIIKQLEELMELRNKEMEELEWIIKNLEQRIDVAV